MYLINTTTLELHPFLGKIPPYVILSHTWGEDEVSFESMHKPDTLDRGSYGYRKIKQCCRLAKKDGYKWAWVDTCCIDKRSSSELSEAINSMYRYYWEADKCYARLSDVCVKHELGRSGFKSACDATNRLEVPIGNHSDISVMSSENIVGLLRSSRWFTRGWTLQELLAPAVVEFYDIHWTLLGTKSNLAIEIGKITGIKVCHLHDRTSIKTASLGLRLSWASKRQTTRDEDIAYCLLGIVGINMPLLYGEGRRAFRRLQIELLKKTRDHTMFSWSTFSRSIPENLGRVSVSLALREQSFLAPSPAYFMSSFLESVHPTFSQPLVESSVLEMTALGLHITLPCIEEWSQPKGCVIAVLDCVTENSYRVGITLQKRSDGRYKRPDPAWFLEVSPEKVARAVTKELYICDEDLEERDDTRIPWCAFKVDSLTMEGISESHVRGYTVEAHSDSHLSHYQDARQLMNDARDFCGNVAEIVSSHQAISFAIRLRSINITVLSGDFDGHSWLRVVLSDDELAKRDIQRLTEEFGKGFSSEHLRNSVTASRGRELRVDVHARRSLLHREEYMVPCWQLAIHIRAGSALPLR